MATYAYPIPNGKVNSEGLTKIISTLYTGSGVIFPDSLTVSASGTPDMNIVVSGSLDQDVAVVIAPSRMAYVGWNTDNKTVTIEANGTGVTKKDTVVAYFDLSKGDSEIANAPESLSFVAVRGEGTNTAPTDAAINALVGHSHWIRLADVTVANGATSINSGNITDVRVRAKVDGEMVELSDKTINPKTVNASLADISLTGTGNYAVPVSGPLVSLYSRSIPALPSADGTYKVLVILMGRARMTPPTAKGEQQLELRLAGVSSGSTIASWEPGSGQWIPVTLAGTFDVPPNTATTFQLFGKANFNPSSVYIDSLSIIPIGLS